MQVVGTPEFISLFITNGNNEISTEKRFLTTMSLAEFKSRLELITGCNHKRMKLEVYDDEENMLGELNDDMSCLGDHNLQNGSRVHVIDPQAAKELIFDENAERFEMSYEEYLKRPDTIVAWMKKNKIGRFREIPPEEKQKIEEERMRIMEAERAALNEMNIGDRCEVKIPNLPTRRGVVQYKGPLEGRKGLWVGIEFDEPVGDSNGSFNGKVHFTCQPKYGGFSKPEYVQVGDFPEFGLDDVDEF